MAALAAVDSPGSDGGLPPDFGKEKASRGDAAESEGAGVMNGLGSSEMILTSAGNDAPVGAVTAPHTSAGNMNTPPPKIDVVVLLSEEEEEKAGAHPGQDNNTSNNNNNNTNNNTIARGDDSGGHYKHEEGEAAAAGESAEAERTPDCSCTGEHSTCDPGIPVQEGEGEGVRCENVLPGYSQPEEQHDTHSGIDSAEPHSHPSDPGRGAVPWRGKRRLECAECSKKFNRRETFELHRHLHTRAGEAATLTCQDCGLSFQQRSHLVKHRRQHEAGAGGPRSPPDPLSWKPYRCPLCREEFQFTASVDAHMRGHSLDNPFRCAECGEQLSCAVALRDHQRSHAAPPKTTESLDRGAAPQPLPAAVEGHREGEEEWGGPHQCGVCDKRFERASHLQQHRYLHTGEKPFTCPDCGKAFAFLQNMKAHWRLHGGEGVSTNRLPDADRPLKGLLECPECGKGFRHRSVMEGHMRKHTGERPFQCSLCGKRFKYSSYLQQHLVLHSGSKPFPCPVCGKAFAFNQNMKAHWKLHQEKPHRCPHCRKGYSEEGQLREHLASHAGDKPHLCGLCGKSFGLACQLRDHQDTHSGERPYRCHEGFPWLGSLPVHQKSHESKRQGAAGRARSQKRNRAGGARNQPRPPQVREPGSRGLYGGAFQPQPRRDGAHLFASPEEQAQLLQLLQQQQQLQGAVAPQHRWMEVQQREAVQQLEVNNSAQWQAKMLQQCPRVEAQQLQERATAQQQKQQWQERATEQQSVELQLQERAFGQQQLLGEEQQQQQRMEAQETALEQQCIELRQTEERAGEKRCTQEQREEPQQGGAGEQEEVQEQRGGSPLLKGSEPQPLRPPPAGDGQLQCMECGQAFPREAALHEHYMEHARGDV